MSPDDPRHGSHRGRYAHERAGVPICDPCREATNRYERTRRKTQEVYDTRWLIDGTGTRRRVQALHVLGWSGAVLAARLGWTQQRISQLTSGEQTHTHRETAARVARLYEELCMTFGPSTITKARAARKGWMPPLAWDNIDDPDEKPTLGRKGRPQRQKAEVDRAVVERVLAGEQLHTTVAEKRIIVARWVAQGRSKRQLFQRMGWKEGRYAELLEAS